MQNRNQNGEMYGNVCMYLEVEYINGTPKMGVRLGGHEASCSKSGTSKYMPQYPQAWDNGS